MLPDACPFCVRREVSDPGSDVAIAATPDQSEHRTNERIRAREVRLIDPDGKQLGVKALPEAMSIARSMDLDLVEVAAEAHPPVCRIMDFNRFKYETAQRAKEGRKKATNTSIKEMKYRPKIGVGDFDTKTRQVARFLGEGHKVKITIMFRGREMSHPELGKRILDHVAETVVDVAKVEAEPKLDGRNMIMVLAPDRQRQAAAAKAASSRPSDAPAGANGAGTAPAGAPAPVGAPTNGAATSPPAPLGTAPLDTAPLDTAPPETASDESPSPEMQPVAAPATVPSGPGTPTHPPVLSDRPAPANQ